MTLALQPGDIQKDAEGIRTFKTLGQNMAAFAAKTAYVITPLSRMMRKLLGVPDVSIGVIYQVAVTNDAMSDGNSRCIRLRSIKLKYSLFTCFL